MALYYRALKVLVRIPGMKPLLRRILFYWLRHKFGLPSDLDPAQVAKILEAVAKGQLEAMDI